MVQRPVPGVSATPALRAISGMAATGDVSEGLQAAQFEPKAVPNRPKTQSGGIGAAQADRAAFAAIFTTASKLNQIGAFHMPGYNFQARFAPLVRSGLKRTTIRGRDAQVGTTAYLFTGQRTSSCQRLGKAPITSCLQIQLGWRNGCPHVQLKGKRLTAALVQELAVAEGFVDGREMVSWFESTYKKAPIVLGDGERIVYAGYLIGWTPEVATC
jgi:hypothetical protein